MYKKIIISTVLYILGLVFIAYEWKKREDILEKNADLALLQKRTEEIKKNLPQIYKSFDKLNHTQLNIDDNYLKTKIKFSVVSQVKTRNNQDCEFVLTAKNEKDITSDLQNLYVQSEGLLQFHDVKLKKENDLIKAKIVCRFIPIDVTNISKDIEIFSLKIPSKSTTLFKTPKQHKLFATSDSLQAFIDDRWYSIGDLVGENSYITQVNQFTIKIRKGKKNITIHLGESWL